jgi:ParB family chromosome partitioning protein
MATKRPSLGRGLEALLGSVTPAHAPTPAAAVGAPGTSSAQAAVAAKVTSAPRDEELTRVPVDLLQRGRYQPRLDMRPESLEELANSIRSQGVVQPIVVRPLAAQKAGEPIRYEIIAGERRWRAAQMAGLHDIPAVVRIVPDEAAVAMSLIENIQRENLNPLEEARALDRLIREFDVTHQQAADAVGRSRAAVSNLLRLLELPEAIRKLLEAGQLEMGHARALLTLPANLAIALAQLAASEQLSVREVERRAQQAGKNKPAPKPASPAPSNADIETLEREIGEHLGAKVQVSHSKKGSGRLVIHYHGLDTLDGILEKLRR